MKVSKDAVAKATETNNKPSYHKAPLSLTIQDEDTKIPEGMETRTFKLYTNPADVDSIKYSITMALIDGTESMRYILNWINNCKRIMHGTNTTNGTNAMLLMRSVCKENIWSIFEMTVRNEQGKLQVAQAHAAALAVTRNPGETDAQFHANREAARQGVLSGALPDPTEAMFNIGFNQIVEAVAPFKAVEIQHDFMRTKMRKPADMRTRNYATNLVRLNVVELPQLPPFGANNMLTDFELRQIIVKGVPKTWVTEMDKHGFEPLRHTIEDIVKFCERMEKSEASNPDAKNNNNGNKKNNDKNKKFKSNNNKSGGTSDDKGDKWCEVHQSKTHNTADCHQVKALQKKNKDKTGDKDGKSKNKTWTKKADEAKTVTKKELNALAKKAGKEAVATYKKDESKDSKRKSKDDDSDASVNVIDQMTDVDRQLAEFNFDDKAKIDDDLSIDV